MTLDVQPPPAAYAIPFTGPMIELRLPYNRVNIVCRMIGSTYEAFTGLIHGCMLWGIGGCLIVVPKIERAITQEDQDAVRAHEIAHCNGWSGKHEK